MNALQLRRTPAAAACALLAIAACTAAPPARAFDGERKGFLLEFGLGPALSTRYDTALDPQTGYDERTAELGFSVSARIHLGYCPLDRLALFYMNDGTITVDESWSEDDPVLCDLQGLGARWYQRDRVPSWHAEGAFGRAATRSFTLSGESEDFSGIGFQLGVGYEFSRGWALGLAGRHLDFDDTIDRSAWDLIVSHAWY